jgi:A/G-specific adenine glycosylase
LGDPEHGRLFRAAIRDCDAVVGLFSAAVSRPSLRNEFPTQTFEPVRFGRELLAWYDRHQRVLPWRSTSGARPDPYAVWLSEIMLQQTRVEAVAPYYLRFLEAFPTIETLALAPQEAVLALWAGLGYYARGRNLHACARTVLARHGGIFPQSEAELLALPGIGPYTSAAIRAISFEAPVLPVDGNVERVLARVFRVRTPLPRAKAKLRSIAARIAPQWRAGDFAQAMMDLGATICTPRKPKCIACPCQAGCQARLAGEEADLPRRSRRLKRPLRHGVLYWLERKDGAVLIRRRPASGLFGGMPFLPTSEWRAESWSFAQARRAAPVAGRWQRVPGTVRHGLTHFELELILLCAKLAGRPPRGEWWPAQKLETGGLPSLIRKTVRHARAAGQARG